MGVATDNILAANGSMELIRLIVLAYLGHGESTLILEPTFGEWEVACQIAGVAIFRQWAKATENFAPRVEETAALIKRHQPKAVFICNPNNPTGQYLSREEVEMVLNACANSLLVLDEAYVAFVDESWSSVDLVSRNNVVIVRSMTKDYTLAGLRLGYAIGSREIVGSLRRVCPRWNVNVMAQKAGIIMLEDADYLKQCKQKIRQAKQFLIDELCRLGFTLMPSKANFFLVKVGDAKAFRSALLRHGILVRDCTSFGLPEYVRVSPRTPPENEKLIEALKNIQNSGQGLSKSQLV